MNVLWKQQLGPEQRSSRQRVLVLHRVMECTVEKDFRAAASGKQIAVTWL